MTTDAITPAAAQRSTSNQDSASSEKLGLSSLNTSRPGNLLTTPLLNSPPLPSGERNSGRMKLTTTLGNLFGLGATQNRMTGESGGTGSGSEEGSYVSVNPGGMDTGMEGIGRAVVDVPRRPHTTPTQSTDQIRRRRPKPPISLPPLFRRDRSQSSGSSVASGSTPPLSRTLPTTPGRENRSASLGTRIAGGWSSRASFSTRTHSNAGSIPSTPVTRSRATSEESPQSPNQSFFPHFPRSTNIQEATTTATNQSSTSNSRPSEDPSNSTESMPSADSHQDSTTSSSISGEGSSNSRGTGYGFFRRRGSQSSIESDEGHARDRRCAGEEPVLEGEADEEELEEEAEEARQENLEDFITATSPDSQPAKDLGPPPPFTTLSGPPIIPLNIITTSTDFSPENETVTPVAPQPTSPSGAIFNRRAVRNIDGLRLDGLAITSSATRSPSISPDSLSALPAPVASSSTATTHRLRTLPRLLSQGAYSFDTLRAISHDLNNSPGDHSTSPGEDDDGMETDPETEHEQETQTETETETEMETDTEGSDEGVTTHSQPEIPRSSSFDNPPPRAITRNSRRRPSTGNDRTHSSSSFLVPQDQSSGPNWVTFDALTPSPMPTARPEHAGPSTTTSYFDLPRSVVRTPRTPGAPMMSPLIPMAMGSVARGKRPTREDEIEVDPEIGGREGGASIYRQRSHSAIDLTSPGQLDSDDEEVGTAGMMGLDQVWQSGGLTTPVPSFLSPTISQAASPILSPRQRRISLSIPKLNRPRSMYELHVAPPAYHAVYTRAGLGPAQIVYPREEEGKEGLPDYTCFVHFEGYLPRKLEFTAPSVQAKDRGWKRHYFVLHGTSIKIFKYDLRTHPIAGEDQHYRPPGSTSIEVRPEALHFHQGEYGTTPDGNNSSSSTSKFHPINKAKSHLPVPSHTNVCLRQYTLQNAESGLAADYVKRKHVVRVRAEGEQFLLQAKDDRGVIDLIEALQAASNVSLDLDVRPLPKFITLPRRRRRRRVPPLGGTVADPGALEAVAAVAAAIREESRLGELLAEEQTAYAGASSGTVM